PGRARAPPARRPPRRERDHARQRRRGVRRAPRHEAGGHARADLARRAARALPAVRGAQSDSHLRGEQAMSAAAGTLYGRGAGPGAPDLLTLRAKKILERTPVLALPRASEYATSTAWSIIAPVIERRTDQERLFLTFPMSKDPARVRPCIEAACDAIAE